MTLLLELYGVLVVTSFLFIGYVMLRHVVAAWWYRIHDTEFYPPEAAQAPTPLDEHFNTAPKDDLDIDWHRYEYEMKRKQT